MIDIVKGNLYRQEKALELLNSLLEEEFSHLQNGEPKSVTGTEMALQELMRQVAVERVDLKSLIQELAGEGARLAQLMDSLSGEDRTQIEKLLAAIDAREQACAMQAAKNNALAVALYDQSKAMVEHLRMQVTPQHRDVYTVRGRYAKSTRSGAALIKGTL